MKKGNQVLPTPTTWPFTLCSQETGYIKKPGKPAVLKISSFLRGMGPRLVTPILPWSSKGSLHGDITLKWRGSLSPKLQRNSLGQQTPLTVNLSLWPQVSLSKNNEGVTRETRARAVSLQHIRAQFCLQAKDLDSLVFRNIWHVTIILLLIFGPCILNCLLFFVSKSLDERGLLRDTNI